MVDNIEVAIPPDSYRADVDMTVLWNKTGMLVGVARDKMPFETLVSVMLSRVMREMRREWGAETAKAVLQGFVDTMEQSAAGDR